MRTLLRALVFNLALCGFVSTSFAEDAKPENAAANLQVLQATGDRVMNHLSLSAAGELSKSIEELNQLRNQISSEKLPLAEELTALEEKLAQLRREHDQVTRLVDSGNLELSTIRSEIKVRQDELAYLSTLLDEYARSLESKLNVSELQYSGETLEAAKDASENTALSRSEKFGRQVALVSLSIKRLFDAIGGMRFAGVGVNPEGTVEDGEFVICGPVALFRSTSGDTAGLVLPQAGSTKPLIRPLEGELQSGIESIVATGSGLLPLDPSRGGALKALVEKVSLVRIFEKGGPIMWPLLVTAILAFFTVAERFIFLMIEQRRRDPKAMEDFLASISQGDTEDAIRISEESKYHVLRTLGYALTHKSKSLANAIMYAQEQEMKRFRRGIPILDTVITLAPLLGLLGTVTGMMGSFSLIGGELSAPGAITGGIAEALIATAFGLGIAITSLIPFNYLNTKMEEARIETETAATQLELGLIGQAMHVPAEVMNFRSAGLDIDSEFSRIDIGPETDELVFEKTSQFIKEE
jgi:biopolymer transport protein ExbB